MDDTMKTDDLKANAAPVLTETKTESSGTVEKTTTTIVDPTPPASAAEPSVTTKTIEVSPPKAKAIVTVVGGALAIAAAIAGISTVEKQDKQQDQVIAGLQDAGGAAGALAGTAVGASAGIVVVKKETVVTSAVPAGSLAASAQAFTTNQPTVTLQAMADDDHDGVVNMLDQCPKTEPGRPVNKSGCPELPAGYRFRVIVERDDTQPAMQLPGFTPTFSNRPIK